MRAKYATALFSASISLCAAITTAHAVDAPATGPASAISAAAATAARTDVGPLTGRWIVDLRAAPDEPGYDKQMVLEIAPDRTVRGSFYDSVIEAGQASASNGRVCFSFRTTDGVGPYHTSGCLVGDRILGQTWAEHRKFVLNWTAGRE
ncbi:MAG: hypothetical protein ACRC6L_08390 [Steroidobacteraceae bacterium]